MRYVDEAPPLEQPQRFGNKAYRKWSDLVRDVSRGEEKEEGEGNVTEGSTGNPISS